MTSPIARLAQTAREAGWNVRTLVAASPVTDSITIERDDLPYSIDAIAWPYGRDGCPR